MMETMDDAKSRGNPQIMWDYFIKGSTSVHCSEEDPLLWRLRNSSQSDVSGRE